MSTCHKNRATHLTRLHRVLCQRFPGLEAERLVHLVDGEDEGAVRAVVTLRAAEPDATIFVLSTTRDHLALRRLMHAGADGVFDDRHRDERNALMRAAATHVARGGSRSTVASACRALRSLLAEWNTRMNLIMPQRASA